MLGWILVVCLLAAGLLLFWFVLMRRGGVEEKEKAQGTQRTEKRQRTGNESRDEKMTTYVCSECNQYDCNCYPETEKER